MPNTEIDSNNRRDSSRSHDLPGSDYVRVPVENNEGMAIGMLVIKKEHANTIASIAVKILESPRLHVGVKTSPPELVTVKIGWDAFGDQNAKIGQSDEQPTK